MCDELKDWIGEKINGINLDDVGKDLASVKVLQRKQQNLEQELKPIEEKINKMSLMANAYVRHYNMAIQLGAFDCGHAGPVVMQRSCFCFLFLAVRSYTPWGIDKNNNHYVYGADMPSVL